MSLKILSDQELITSTEQALKIMREAEVEVLRHFQEIEERRLWAEARSLYKYIANTFQLTADQIYPRLQAMRLMRAIPEVEQKLEAGELSMTNALKAQQTFRAEAKQRVVPMEEKKALLRELKHASTKEADKVLAERYPASKRPPEKVTPVDKNQNLIQFYVDNETLKQIEELKAKFSHQMPSGKMEDLLKILIQKATREPNPRKAAPAQKRSRHIPAEVKREMEKTRSQSCAHLHAKTGQRCGTTHFLQMDHIHEYGEGGGNEFLNLQWLCGSHNRHRFETGRGDPKHENTRHFIVPPR